MDSTSCAKISSRCILLFRLQISHYNPAMRPSSMMRCSCRQFASRSPSAFRPSRIPQPRPQTLPTSCIRPQLLPIRRAIPSAFRRHESTTSGPTPPLESTTTPPESRLDRDQVPAYELTFTCKKCTTRSSHRVSKQGYHHGTVLITCPGCKNRHLISDHLKVCMTDWVFGRPLIPIGIRSFPTSALLSRTS